MSKLKNILSFTKGKAPMSNLESNKELPYLNPDYLRGKATSELVPASRSSVIVDNGELLLLWDGSNAGEFFRARFGILSSTMVRLDFDQNYIRRDYLYYHFKKIEPFLKSQTSGSGIPHVDKNVLGDIEIALHDGLQQEAIVKVLRGVDNAIARTEALIAKYRRVRTGLMQDLLTTGIDKDGRIRSEETHAFKDSPLGRIPFGWDVYLLGELLNDGPRNGLYKPANYIGEGTLIVGQSAFTDEDSIDFDGARRANVSRSELATFELKKNDVLLTRVYAVPEGVGRSIIAPEMFEPAVYESNMMRLRLKEGTILPQFLFYWLKTYQIRQFILASVNQSNQSSINQREIRKIPCAVPTLQEQYQIVESGQATSEVLSSESSTLYKLRRLKAGLMQDLLTGNVPIDALLTEALPHSPEVVTK